MKLRNIFPVVLLMLTTTFYAQSHTQKREKVKALKIAFITTELELTSTEAAAFWPVYNAYEARQYDLRRQKSKTFKEKVNDVSSKNISEKEAVAILNNMENIDEELYQLRKKANSDLKNIISSVKIVKLKKAEEDFNRNLSDGHNRNIEFIRNEPTKSNSRYVLRNRIYDSNIVPMGITVH